MADKHYALLSEPFGDDEACDFCLDYERLTQLEDKRQCGPMVLLDRLESGTWTIPDIREIVRAGLIGAGKTPAEAAKLVRLFIDARPPLESLGLAYRVLAVAVAGPAPKTADAPNGHAKPGAAADADPATSPSLPKGLAPEGH